MKKKVYSAPIVEVLEARVEKGFQISGCPSSMDAHLESGGGMLEGIRETETKFF